MFCLISQRPAPPSSSQWLAVVFVFLGITVAVVHAEDVSRVRSAGAPASFRTTTPGSLSGLALSDRTLQQIDDRLSIDTYQATHYAVAPGMVPAPRVRFAAPARVPAAVLLIPPSAPPAVAAFRLTNQSHFLPPRGFRAPILENASEFWRPQLGAGLSPAELRASRLVEQRLAADGLLPTLARMLHALGPQDCLTNLPATHHRLLALGYPADLLHHFRLTESSHPGQRPLLLIEHFARRLLDAPGVEDVIARPPPVVFDFQPSLPGLSWVNRLRADVAAQESRSAGGTIDLSARFEVAVESGDHEIGLLRMQVGGGWRDGIIPGGSLDVVGQMVNHFRSADFLVSVAEAAWSPLQTLITNSWRLRRRHQVTLCVESVEPSAWAQDNGKAGVIRSAAGLPPRLATLAPRFACMDEGKSVFLPAESYLMDGLRASGHPVIHSPLIFQGGNLLGVREPRSARRLLVISQGDVHRNRALGLSRAEILAAFTAEFGVDDCLILPVLSYHLDFDVTFRNTGRELLAFVNDASEAARRIVALGLEAFLRHHLLDPAAAATLKNDLAERRDQTVVNALAAVVQRHRAGTNALPLTLARAFVHDGTDDAAGNLQVFLLALDLLESALQPIDSSPNPNQRTAYLNALRRLEEARRRQITALAELGCRTIPIPSQHDLYRSINYLNGLQHRGGYVMPVFGGFYTPLDQAAATAIRAALGPDLHITSIQTAECQRMHGGVHCTASVFPKLD